MKPHRYIGNIRFFRSERDGIDENEFSNIAMFGYTNAEASMFIAKWSRTMFLCG